MREESYLLLVVGVVPAAVLWWRWRRTTPPGDNVGMALAAGVFFLGLGAMFATASALGLRPTALECVWLAFIVLFASWKELARNPRRVSPLDADAAAEDEEADRFRGGGTSLG